MIGAQQGSNRPSVTQLAQGLGGRAGGRLEGNRHIQANEDEPTSNLLLGMADMLGAEIETIGIATNRLLL